jgi:hypothetical protein
MYETLDIHEIYVTEAQKFVIKNDRYFYVPYLRLLEEYCIKNNILIGGEIGINMLLNKEINKDDFTYEIYASEPFDSARELANIFYDYLIKCSKDNTQDNDCTKCSKTIYVESNIKHKLFTIWFNIRPFIKIHKLDKHRDVKLIELISPITLPARFIKNDKMDNKILVMSEEIQLISIYKQLYNPYPTTEYKNYTKLLDIENNLYNKMINQISKKVVGSGDNKLLEYSQKIIDGILNMLSTNKLNDQIIIGDYAIDKIVSKIGGGKRLQILMGDSSQRDIDNMKDLLDESFIKTINNNIQKFIIDKIAKNVKLTTKYIKYDMNIPVDPFLRKYTIYLQLDDKSMPIMDIFNSLSYELVPFKMIDGLKYGGLFVLMRFKLIDIYSSRLIIKLSSKKQEVSFIENKIYEFISQLKLIKEKINKQIVSDNLFDLFQLNDYSGIYYPQNILNKILMGDTKFKFTKYYPYLKDKLQ